MLARSNELLMGTLFRVSFAILIETASSEENYVFFSDKRIELLENSPCAKVTLSIVAEFKTIFVNH